jgi:putative FmdB family regulatory protein
MPTYHFECEQCKTQFEMDAPMGSKDRPPCIKCNSKRVRKLIKPPMVHFKGAGFYKTDSQSSSSKSAAPKPAEPAKPVTPPPATATPSSPSPSKNA